MESWSHASEVCAAYLSCLARLYTVGDVKVDKLSWQAHSCGQAVDHLHAVEAQVHCDQHAQILTDLTTMHQPQQHLHSTSQRPTLHANIPCSCWASACDLHHCALCLHKHRTTGTVQELIV